MYLYVDFHNFYFKYTKILPKFFLSEGREHDNRREEGTGKSSIARATIGGRNGERLKWVEMGENLLATKNKKLIPHMEQRLLSTNGVAEQTTAGQRGSWVGLF